MLQIEVHGTGEVPWKSCPPSKCRGARPIVPLFVLIAWQTEQLFGNFCLHCCLTPAQPHVALSLFLWKKIRNFPEPPNPWYFLKVSLVQMGGVLRYKWERRTAVQIGCVLRRFPFSKALKPARHSVTNGGRTAVQIGGVPPVLFRQVVRVGGS